MSIINIGFDATDVHAGVPSFAADLESMNDVVIRTLISMQKFNDETGETTTVVKGLSASGREITQTFRGLEVVSQTIKAPKDQLKEFAKGLAKVGEEAEAAKVKADALARQTITRPKILQQQVGESEEAAKVKADALARKEVQAQIERAPATLRRTGEEAENAKIIADAKTRAKVLADISKQQAEEEIKNIQQVKKIRAQQDKDLEKALKETAKLQSQYQADVTKRTLQQGAISGGDRLRREFPVPDTASISQIKAYEAAIAGVEKQLASGKLTVQTFNEAVGKLKTDPKTALPGVAGAGQLRTVATAFDEVGKAGEDAGQRITISWQGALRLFQALILRDIGRQIVGQLTEAVGGAIKFHDAMLRVQSATVGTGADIDKLKDNFSALSATFVLTREEVAKIGFEEFGSRLKDADGSTRILAEGLRLAKITGADNAATVTLLNETLKTYKVGADQAVNVSSKFAVAIQEGALNTKQFESGFGRLATTAKTANVSLDDTLGALVVLSNSGLKTSEAIESLEGVLNKIIKPSEEMQVLFQKWGVTAETVVPTFGGLQGVFQKLGEEVQSGGLAKLGDLEKDFRAIKGAGVLISPEAIDGLGDFNEKLKTSIEQLEKMNAVRLDDQLTQLQQFKQTASNAFEVAAEGAAKFANAIGKVGAKGIETIITQPIRDIAGTVSGQYEQERLSEALDKRIAEQRGRNPEAGVGKIAGEGIGGGIEGSGGRAADIKTRLASIAEARKEITAFQDAILSGDKKIQSTLEREFGAYSEKIKLEAKSIDQAIKDQIKTVEDSEKRIADIKVKQETKSFERSIANLTPGAQAEATRQRVDKLQGEASDLFKAGNLEEARKKFDEMEKLLDRVYQHQSTFRKEAEKLGVKFTTPIDDSKEQEVTKQRIDLEQALIQKQKDDYKSLLDAKEGIKALDQEALDVQNQINDLNTKRTADLQAQAAIWEAIADSAQRIKDSFGFPPAPAAQAQSWGGFIRQRFAEGGPVGTDTIPAWLSPGEFVVNAEQTQKFFPQLVLMNQGVQPMLAPTVGNRTTNVGDINIHVASTDSTQNTVRQLGQQLRREIRRQTIRLDPYGE